ncbi:hypothetical protein HDU80_001656, partial [Chytriomyces hyalinus]
MDPSTSVDALETSNIKLTSCLGSITRSAAFETMPPEILVRIAQFVDSKSILPLCHSIPCYKYISAAMFDFAHRFPYKEYTLSKLWPDMYFPEILTFKTKWPDFPIEHMHAAGV